MSQDLIEQEYFQDESDFLLDQYMQDEESIAQFNPTDQIDKVAYVEILDPVRIDDSGFDYLLQETNTQQIDQALSHQPELFHVRVAKIFNMVAHLFQMVSTVDVETQREYRPHLERLIPLFLQNYYVGQYQGINSNRSTGIRIRNTQEFINLLLDLILMPSDQTSSLRLYLPRLFIFSINPPPPYISFDPPSKSIIKILNRIQSQLFDDEFYRPEKLDIVALTFFSNAHANISAYTQFTEIFGPTLESTLENEQHHEEQQISLLKLIQVLIAFSTHQGLVEIMYRKQLHCIVYKSIKFSTPAFNYGKKCISWAKEPLIVQSLVGLIIRIISNNPLDNNFATMLLNDFKYLLEKQKFEFIYQVILPIMNSEQVKLVPICFHHQAHIDELRQQVLTFIKSQSKTMTIKARLQSDVLNFKQREFMTAEIQKKLILLNEEKVKQQNQLRAQKEEKQQQKNKLEEGLQYDMQGLEGFFQMEIEQDPVQAEDPQNKLQKKVQKEDQVKIMSMKPQLQIQAINKELKFMQQEYLMQSEDQSLLKDATTSPAQLQQDTQENKNQQQQFEQSQKQLQQEPILLQQELPVINGSWVHLHSFNHSNPVFDFKHLTKALEPHQNALFLFELFVGDEVVVLATFIDNLLHDKKQQNYIQAKSSNYSLFFILVQDLIEVVSSSNQAQYSILDLSQQTLQISDHNQPIACINFHDIGRCKFGFPFQRLSNHSLLLDQIKAAMESDQNSLMSIELWTFDSCISGSQSNFDLKLSEFSTRSYDEHLNFYLSQFRFDKIFMVPQNATIDDISLAIEQKVEPVVLDPTKINDIYVAAPVNQCLIKKRQEKPQLKYFQANYGSLVDLILQMEKHLYKSNQNEKSAELSKNFLGELRLLMAIPKYEEAALNEEGFLQLILAVTYLHAKPPGQQAYHKGLELMYSLLRQCLPSLDKRKLIEDNNLIYNIVSRIKQLGFEKAPDAQSMKGLFQPQKVPINQQNKGKPKGVGYGDSNYSKVFTQAKKPEQVEVKEAVNQEIVRDQRERTLKELFLCLIELFKCPASNETHVKVSEISFKSMLSTYLSSLNITTLQNKDLTPLELFRLLLSKEAYLDLFISEPESLFCQLQGLHQQASIFMKSFNTENDQLKQVLELYEYAESVLRAANLIEVSYDNQEQNQDAIAVANIHQFYRLFMKQLAVDKCIVQTDPDYVAKMGACLSACSKNPPPAKMQRLRSEMSTIEEHLPLEATNSIFIRYDSQRMDCMRTIIFGASGTPYAHGAFLYEMLFGDDYPKRPPKMLLQTTGHGKVRFNPNLYNCGKVCLSLLGTWGDNWIQDFSTILQILVSVQSMVMSEYVMFNEPGWESQMGTPQGEQANRGYCNFIKIQNIRYAMVEQLQKPPQGFEEVIKKSFFLRKDLIKLEIEIWIKEADLPATYNQTQNQCGYQQKPAQYKLDLQAAYKDLVDELDKLKLNIGKDFTQMIPQTNRIKKIRVLKGAPLRRERVLKPNQKPQGLDYSKIDISYDQNFVRKAFNPTDSQVQNLMSRYIGVLGVDAVEKQSEATIYLQTLDALGVEIAKNIVLSGVKKLVLHDDHIVQREDLCGQFYLTEADLGKKRSVACLQKLQQLNNYVSVEYVEGEQANYFYSVIVTQDPEFAKNCPNRVAVILVQCRNVYGRIVTDFGDEFTITDKDGEAPSEINVESIENNIVTSMKKQPHNLSVGDFVIFQEVQESGNGESYNEQQFEVLRVVNSFKFEINNRNCKQYLEGGVAYQQKQRVSFRFKRIKEVLGSLDCFCEMAETQLASVQRDFIHILLNEQLTIGWTLTDLEQVLPFLQNQNIKMMLQNKYNEDVLSKYLFELLTILLLIYQNGQIPPLQAYIGGVASQEVLKAITRKYTPINQVWVVNRDDVLPFKQDDLKAFVQITNGEISFKAPQFKQFFDSFGLGSIVDPRYAKIRNLLGNLNEIQSSTVFMVGAGAIGCELLKNYAMCGIGTQGKGAIYVTDPDHIENSNLSRQFLFREKHIRQPKSLTAAAVAQSMNPNIKIIARLDRVGPETLDIYSNYFFKTLDCVTNALDNVQARLFVDQRCVENEIPLIESGTLGPKGHVQVIIPHLTESYGSQQDPEQQNEIPYCTLKMFPESIVHCLEWGRDKFEQYFVRKPQALQTVLESRDLRNVQQQTLDMAIKAMQKLPRTFQDCVALGRNKFEKLFRADIQKLLKAYPIDTKTKEGKLFWAPPKRAPRAIELQDLQFVEDFALLTAQVHGIPIPHEYDIRQMVSLVQVQSRVISNEKLEQIKQQAEKKEDQMQVEVQNHDDLVRKANSLMMKLNQVKVYPQQFEKDDDMNHHVSFVMAATNGRAENYHLNRVDWMWVKLKAGRIIPAMATTTSCIAALQTIELLKLLGQKNKAYLNTFMNLAIPLFALSEPGDCQKRKIGDKEFSLWTKYLLTLNSTKEPLKYVVKRIEGQFKDVKAEVASVEQGVKAIYIAKMLPKTEDDLEKFLCTPIFELIDIEDSNDYVDLDVRLLIQNQEVSMKFRVVFEL